MSVIGMILAVALPTLGKTVRPSKISEASEQLDVLYRAAAAYYAQARPAPEGGLMHCLPGPAGPTPEMPSTSPVHTDFAAISAQGAPTWQSLGFTPSSALRYRYTFAPSTWGCSIHGGPAESLILRAEGDLDGDGVLSRFERRAQILPSGKLLGEPVLHVEERIE